MVADFPQLDRREGFSSYGCYSNALINLKAKARKADVFMSSAVC